MILAAIIVAVLAPTATGCYDREDLENVAFSLALGLDSAPDGQVEMTTVIGIPAALAGAGGGQGTRGGSKGGSPNLVLTVTGRSVTDAIIKVDSTINRRLSFAHNSVIVFGESLTRRGIADVLGFILRFVETRRDQHLMMSLGPAREFLQIQPTIEKNVAEYLTDLFRIKLDKDTVAETTLGDFAVAYQSGAGGSFIPVMRKVPPSNPAGGSSETGGGDRADVVGHAVFKGDRLAGIIGPELKEAFSLAAGKFTVAAVLVPDPLAPGKWVAVEITRPGRRVSARVDGDQVRIVLEITVEGDLIEIESVQNYGNPENLRLLERALSEKIRGEVSRVIRQVQDMGADDPFRFGEVVKIQFLTWPDWIAFDWPKRFREAEVEVRVKAFLRRPGQKIQGISDFEGLRQARLRRGNR